MLELTPNEYIIKRLYLLRNAIYKLFISSPPQLFDDRLLYNETIKYYQLKTSFTEDLLINFYTSLSGDFNTTVDNLLLHSKMEGIVTGLQIAGDQLQKYFPHNNGDSNELTDDIAFMDGE